MGCEFAHADTGESFIDEESFERIEHFTMPWPEALFSALAEQRPRHCGTNIRAIHRYRHNQYGTALRCA